MTLRHGQACKLKFRVRDLTSCSAAAPAVCFKGRVAGVETGNEFSQLRFKFTTLVMAPYGGSASSRNLVLLLLLSTYFTYFTEHLASCRSFPMTEIRRHHAARRGHSWRRRRTCHCRFVSLPPSMRLHEEK